MQLEPLPVVPTMARRFVSGDRKTLLHQHGHGPLPLGTTTSKESVEPTDPDCHSGTGATVAQEPEPRPETVRRPGGGAHAKWGRTVTRRVAH
jgi:hypothetical protein